ncbi:hypothetical protein JW921_08950 [Candidatus Fermentibacterales bacterium]|nr:hypothetical protein [Candidatus Fermentibacterales bacterium]
MTPERTPGYYLYVLLRNRWFLVKAILVVMVPTVIVSYFLPKKYTATTLLMPPDVQTSPGIGIGGLAVGEFAGFFGAGMGYALPLMATLSDVYLEILNSRTLVEQVILSTGYIDSMDIREQYEIDEQVGLYWARKAFRNDYSAEVTPSGFLKIEMTTSDPWYSVEVSERVVTVLDSLNRQVLLNRAANARLFIQQQVSNAESLLEASVSALEAFEIEHGVVSLDRELGEYISALASLKRQYLELSAQAQAMRQGFVYGSSGTLRELELRISALADVIESLESGSPDPRGEVRFAFSLSDLPEMQFEYAGLRSDYETALRLTSLLRASLEQARVEESVSTPTIRVLDAPGHPGWKSKPKKLYIWIEVFVVTIVLLFIFLMIRERAWLMREKSPEEWSRWSRLLDDLRGDLRFWRKGGRSGRNAR